MQVKRGRSERRPPQAAKTGILDVSCIFCWKFLILQMSNLREVQNNLVRLLSYRVIKAVSVSPKAQWIGIGERGVLGILACVRQPVEALNLLPFASFDLR